MLEKLKGMVKSLMREAEPFDPRGFGDPIAIRTEWTPAAGGGSSFGTHRLAQVSPSRVAFKPTLGVKMFGGVFFVIGAVIMLVGLGNALGGSGNAVGGIGLLLFGGVFAGAGVFFLRKMGAPRHFDQSVGIYWKGQQKVVSGSDRESLEDRTELGDIYALQIIKEYCSGDDGGYYSYELNLVCRDAARVNVIDHGNLEAIQTDAQQLAVFLGNIPVWDATLPPPPVQPPQWPGAPPKAR